MPTFSYFPNLEPLLTEAYSMSILRSRNLTCFQGNGGLDE
jgi:hypothetical protein